MTKKMLILTIVVLLVAMAVPAAFAAFNSEQEAKLKSIAEEMAALKKQLIDVYVEAGELTAEQGEQIKEIEEESSSFSRLLSFILKKRSLRSYRKSIDLLKNHIINM